MTMDPKEAIAAFLAKGGKVAKVPADASNDISGREWNLLNREGVNGLIRERHTVYGAGNRVYVTNGLGERIS